MVFEEPLAEVADLLQRKRRLVLPGGAWGGAGGGECGAGAVGLAGAAGLALVKLQLSPPLDPTVLLTQVLEDLLWCQTTFSRYYRRGHGVRGAVDGRAEGASLRGGSAGSPR